jgi:hypothetical protein
MVQRGTIIIWGAVGMVAVPPIVPDIIGLIPVIMPDRSIIIAVVIDLPPSENLEIVRTSKRGEYSINASPQ